MNRAVAVVDVQELPNDLSALIKSVRKEAAFRCGFVPFFWGLGTQLVIVVTGARPEKPELVQYLDKVDNQWSIIQSIFVVHVDSGLVSMARTWGQIFTRRFQDAIAEALGHHDGSFGSG